jgi:SAM-dependent methyltransferase
MSTLATARAAADAYDALAPAYDRFTAAHAHDRWLAALEAQARCHGLRGRRVLDVACGTGKSFAPLLARGYDVDACDLSPAMVAAARRRHPDAAARVWVADMRELTTDGPYDLVTCLDDAVNYLLDDSYLARAFAEARRVLAPGGLYVFDVNTLRTYRDAFAAHVISERDGTVFCWRGRSGAHARAGARHEAVLDVFDSGHGGWQRATSVHVQRHHPAEEVLAALQAADLDCVAVVGQRTGGRLHGAPDEDRDTKTVYFARRGGRLSPDTGEEDHDEHHRADHRPVSAGPAAGDQSVAGGPAALPWGAERLF